MVLQDVTYRIQSLKKKRAGVIKTLSIMTTLLDMFLIRSFFSCTRLHGTGRWCDITHLALGIFLLSGYARAVSFKTNQWRWLISLLDMTARIEVVGSEEVLSWAGGTISRLSWNYVALTGLRLTASSCLSFPSSRTTWTSHHISRFQQEGYVESSRLVWSEI